VWEWPILNWCVGKTNIKIGTCWLKADHLFAIEDLGLKVQKFTERNKPGSPLKIYDDKAFLWFTGVWTFSHFFGGQYIQFLFFISTYEKVFS